MFCKRRVQNVNTNKTQLSEKSELVLLRILAFCGVLGIFFIFYKISPFIYLTNDDLFLQSIVSGEVTGTPEAHLLHIGYPVGLFVSTLYRIFPTLPWYGLFLCFSFGLTMWVVLYQLMKLEKTLWARLITFFLVSLGSYSFLFLHIAEIQFTTVTGMVGAGALFLFILGETGYTLKDTVKKNAGFLILSIYALCIRSDGFLMMLPFIGMIGLAKYLDVDKNVAKRKNLFALAGVFLGCMGAVIGIEKLAYSDTQWRNFSVYNDARARVVDYAGYPEYDTHKAIYEELGITHASYEAVAYHYSILLEPNINHSTMGILAEVSEQENGVDLQEIPQKLKEMAVTFIDRHLSYADRPLNLFVYSLYICFFVAAVFCRQKKAMRDMAFTIFARMFIWMYLLYFGRLPIRVSQAVYLAELSILLAIAWKYRLWEPVEHTKRWKVCKVFWSATVLCMAFMMFRFGIPKTDKVIGEVQSRVYLGQAFTDIKEYFAKNEECFYYLDTNSFGYFAEDILTTGTKVYGNYVLMGSWLPRSPWYEKVFEHEGIGEGQTAIALYENPQVYAVFMKAEIPRYKYLEAFYAENYPGVSIEVVEEITVSGGITFQIVKGKTE